MKNMSRRHIAFYDWDQDGAFVIVLVMPQNCTISIVAGILPPHSLQKLRKLIHIQEQSNNNLTLRVMFLPSSFLTFHIDST